MRAASLMLFTFFCSLSAFAADLATCPARIDVGQQLTAPVAGWRSFNDDAPPQLAGVTFYDGSPQEKASLAYDDITRAGGKQIAKWSFAPHRERPIWIACHYSGTSVVLAKPLPDTLTSCAVSYDTHQEVAGLPMIGKIVCK